MLETSGVPLEHASTRVREHLAGCRRLGNVASFNPAREGVIHLSMLRSRYNAVVGILRNYARCG